MEALNWRKQGVNTMTNYSNLTEEELIDFDLLFTEDDRLPKAAVDEFVKRGDRMVGPLAEIVGCDFHWSGDIAELWAVIHSVFILGVIGNEETVKPLLKSLRFSAAYDCDWVTEPLPSIFGKIGIKAIEGLKLITSDYTTEWFTRTLAIEGLAAITITNPEIEKDIFAFIGAIFCNETEDKDVRAQAGHILLDFQKEEFKAALFGFGRDERRLKNNNLSYPMNFDEESVRQAFNSSEMNSRCYKYDWLIFYDENEIRKRQERWEKEAAEEESEEVKEADTFLYSGDTPFVRDDAKIGRNMLCPCGSGKKYKKCCGN